MLLLLIWAITWDQEAPGSEIYPKSTFLSTILSSSTWSLKQEWAEVCPVLVTVPRNGWLAQGHFSPFCQLSQALSIFLKIWDLYQGKKLGAWRLGSCQEMAPIQWIRAPDPLLSCLSQKLCSVQCNIDFARPHPGWIYAMCKVNSQFVSSVHMRSVLSISAVFCVQLRDCDYVQRYLAHIADFWAQLQLTLAPGSAQGSAQNWT